MIDLNKVDDPRKGVFVVTDLDELVLVEPPTFCGPDHDGTREYVRTGDTVVTSPSLNNMPKRVVTRFRTEAEAVEALLRAAQKRGDILYGTASPQLMAQWLESYKSDLLDAQGLANLEQSKVEPDDKEGQAGAQETLDDIAAAMEQVDRNLARLKAMCPNITIEGKALPVYRRLTRETVRPPYELP